MSPPASRPRPGATPVPERWSAESGERNVVRLDIPADAQRERRFELHCQLDVVQRGDRPGARHGLRITVDGALEWERTVATDAGGVDLLEWRLSRTVPVGRPLRVVATCVLAGVQRQRLRLSADEE